MKFGKQFRARIRGLRSEAFFLDYKELKISIRQLLGKLAGQAGLGGAANAAAAPGAISFQTITPPQRALIKAETTTFVEKLRREINKINNYYRRVLKRIGGEWDQACVAMSELGIASSTPSLPVQEAIKASLLPQIPPSSTIGSVFLTGIPPPMLGSGAGTEASAEPNEAGAGAGDRAGNGDGDDTTAAAADPVEEGNESATEDDQVMSILRTSDNNRVDDSIDDKRTRDLADAPLPPMSPAVASLVRATTRAANPTMSEQERDLERQVTARKAVFQLEAQAHRLAEFLSLNREALQKILKKFDKKVPGAHLQDALLGPVMARFQNKVDRLVEIMDMMNHFVAEHELNPPEAEMSEDTTIDDYTMIGSIPTVTKLVLEAMPAEDVTFVWLTMGRNGAGVPITVPVMVAKGRFEGPVVGITSALHGNELNGVPLISQLFREIDVTELCGTIVAVPVLNTEGYMRNQRAFLDGQDLNRLFPGKKNGNSGQAYVHKVMTKIVCHFTHLIDLHTASFGRVNSLYVRVDMNDPVARRMALLQSPEIIVHNTSPDGSLRNAAAVQGIPAITVEIGNPSAFHPEYIRSALKGVEDILSYLRMTPGEDTSDLSSGTGGDGDQGVVSVKPPAICGKSYWLYSQSGGVLTIKVDLVEWVSKGDVIATLHDLFGQLQQTYRAPEDGIVVGKSSNPCCSTGDRIIHLGVLTDEFAAKADDGHT